LEIVFGMAQKEQIWNDSVINKGEMINPKLSGGDLWVIKETELIGDNDVDQTETSNDRGTSFLESRLELEECKDGNQAKCH